MTTNKRLVLDSLSTLRLEEVPLASPPEGSVVVKITHAGVCYSDVHMAHTPKFHPTFIFPRVLGHEICGVVHEFSPEAKKSRSDLSVGDRVMVFPWGNCQNCDFCRGDCTFCMESAYGKGPRGNYTYGVWRDGGYQQYVTVDKPRFLVKVPGNVESKAAALIPCSGITAYNGVSAMRESVENAQRTRGNALVGVVGAGGLGLWALQIIKALYGPKVTTVAIDIEDSKVQDAKKGGADIAYKWDRDEPAAEAVKKLVASVGDHFDAVIDLIGAAPVVERSFLSLNVGGTLVLVGLSGNMMPAMTLNSVLRRNVIIRGSMVGSLPQLIALSKLVEENKVVPPPIEEIALEVVPETMEKLRKGQQRGRAVIKM